MNCSIRAAIVLAAVLATGCSGGGSNPTIGESETVSFGTVLAETHEMVRDPTHESSGLGAAAGQIAATAVSSFSYLGAIIGSYSGAEAGRRVEDSLSNGPVPATRYLVREDSSRQLTVTVADSTGKFAVGQRVRIMEGRNGTRLASL